MDPESSQLPASEPMKASAVRRAFGWLIDYAIVMVPAVTVVFLALSVMLHGLPGYVGAVAAEFGWSHLVRLITQRGTGAGLLGVAASKEWVAFAAPLIGALLVVPLIQFAYHAMLLSWRGRTVGKMLTDTRVAIAANEARRVRGRRARRRALTTTFLETGLVSFALIVVVLGQFSIGLLVWAAAVVAFWVNAFAALGPRRRTIVDRLTGTVVIRSTLHADLAIAAVAKTSDTAVAAVQMTSDAAVVAGQLVQEGARSLISSAPVQQALNSRAAQQAQAFGAAGADRAREIGGQAAGQVRQLGGRARQLLRERQAKRNQRTAEIPEPTEAPENSA